MDTSSFRSLQCRESFTGIGGITLKVAQLGWDAGTSLEEVEAGALATRLIATQDGGQALTDQWHSGECTEEVFAERYELRGGIFARVFHGWIDAESRQLVQAG